MAAKISEVTFGASTTESTMPNLMSGFSAATCVIGPEYAKPMPRITLAPLSTSWLSRSTFAESGSPAPASSSPTTLTPVGLGLIERLGRQVVERLVAAATDVVGQAH